MTTEREVYEAFLVHLRTIVEFNCQHNFHGKYHEHFVLNDSSLMALTKRNPVQHSEWVEYFFDTRDAELLNKNYWLRLSSDGGWSLKRWAEYEQNVLAYEEETNEDSIFSILSSELGRKDSNSLLNLCPIPIAVFATHRYYFASNNSVEFWIDVASFGKHGSYVIATIEAPLATQDSNIQIIKESLKSVHCLEDLAASKVVAYLYKTNQDLFTKVKSAIPPLDNSFFDANPFGHPTVEGSSLAEITHENEDKHLQELTSLNS